MKNLSFLHAPLLNCLSAHAVERGWESATFASTSDTSSDSNSRSSPDSYFDFDIDIVIDSNCNSTGGSECD